ncbi:S24 family peptidase [Pacificibacter marinus]|uniref:S24 family peptidase n=1 Tax=Pacificibacter marinus TaxID=658057 RepID=UPI001C06BD8B|nr:S24 family peptidase [Pacificibacter marinus]MBU2867110.1 S24 family peptidase [Pacificibacter marinus]
MDPILETIDKALAVKGLSDAAASKLAVGHPSLIKNLRMPRQGEKRYNLPALMKLAGVLDLEFYFGPPRETGDVSQPPAADPEEFANIPLHEASLAAGAGAANGAEPVVDYLSFRRDWLRRIGTAPASAVLARVSGDSMEPTIWAGDMVLVDRSKTVVPVRTSSSKKGRSAIYAVLDDGHARVKRIERPSEDQILLLSDNPDYTPEFANPKTLSIIGKVMWWGHTNRD